MVDPVPFLKRHPYFSALPSTTLAAVARRGVAQAYKRGSLIFTEGDPASNLYLVAAGTVRIFKTSEDGKEQVLHHIRPGQSFNDVAALDGGPSPASAQAVGDAIVILIPRRALLDLLARYPDLALRVIQTFAARLREMSRLVETLSLHHVASRVAAALLRLSEGGPSAPLPTRQELAAMVGTVREVATRALKDLERLGAIALGPGRRATILDRRRLQHLAGSSELHGSRPHLALNSSRPSR